MNMHEPPQPHYTAEERRKRVFAIVSASSGNLVEWFDFYVYSFARSTLPAVLPEREPHGAVAEHGRRVRRRLPDAPDRRLDVRPHRRPHGRKNSMLISVLMMCFGSLAIACLPTYASIGVAAPILLLFIRCSRACRWAANTAPPPPT
jgi:MFS family permease